MISTIKNNRHKKEIVAIAITMLSLSSFAQEVAPVAPTTTSAGMNPIWWLIFGTMIILLVVVLILGNVLVGLTQVQLNKIKQKATALIALLFTTAFAFAQDPANAVNNAPVEAVKVSQNVFGDWTLIMATIVLVAELFAIIVLIIRIRSVLANLEDKPKESTATFNIQLPKFIDNLNASVAIEKEKDIMLDHDYDGIQELDNNLPPWWKYGFYFTIVWSVFYLGYYHVAGGPLSLDEYAADMERAKVETEEYVRKNASNVDESNITLADAAGINEGKSIYTTNCVTCHGKNAEGTVGPNLTDEYWIHGGALSDVFKSVKYGWPAKGMKSWSTDLTPVDMKNVVSYIP
jgi:cytochrome c oxidase cbb3-type subunit 3